MPSSGGGWEERPAVQGCSALEQWLLAALGASHFAVTLISVPGHLRVVVPPAAGFSCSAVNLGGDEASVTKQMSQSLRCRWWHE